MTATCGTARSGEPFATMDGAYVLGALDPAERAEFEAHLRTCAACRAEVAEIAPLPGLLGLVRDEPESVPDPLLPDPLLPDTLLPGLLRRAAR